MNSPVLRVCYVALDDAPATRAAWAWLSSRADLAAFRVAPDSLDQAFVSKPDVLWIDAVTPPALPAEFVAIAFAGLTGLLLTGAAVTLPASLGLESSQPGDVIDRVWHEDEDELFLFRDFSETPRIRGHAAFRRHRLFDGLNGAAYTWWPRDGDAYRAWTWRLPDWPEIAGVVAVERAFIHIEHTRATIWEYASPRIVCIGAHLPFESADPLFRLHRERLALNALLHVAGVLPAPRPDLFWRPSRPGTFADPALVLPAPTRRDGELLPFQLATLRLDGGDASDPFTIAGRRAFGAGTEGGGLAELWFHPVRAMKNTRTAGVDFTSAEVTTLGVERRITAAGQEIVERCFVPGDLPGFVMEWSTDASDSVELHLEWETDLRLMWPYPASALGPLTWHAGEGAMVIRARDSFEAVAFVSDARDASFDAKDASSDDGESLRCSFDVLVAAGEPARLLIAGAAADGDDIDVTIAALAKPAGLVRARAAALRRMQHERLRVVSPEARVDQAIEWAKYRLDSFTVDVPAVGRSLVAGYWTSRPGWNDGRPGYAWFFGRDAVWTAFALLATGDFDAARDLLMFLARKQDLSGKILHECTTSGSVHYDAADSTPLFLLLVARHLAWSGDIRFTRAIWPAVRAALDFCVSTDTDGDGIIENPRVGHGWIEFGRLGGGRATLYNAGIWCAALRELAVSAESIGENETASELRERYRVARAAIGRRFYDQDRAMYALKIEPTDFTPTATHAVPLLLGETDPENAKSWLDLVASEEFTTDWGVRMLPRSDPAYDPGSYHGGAVWPLYTGWVAWAEFAAGRSHSAIRHWRQVADLAFEREKGAWDEVIHGGQRRGMGVCPDQAWSAAMAVAPFVSGLLGAEPDATRNRLRVRPQIPDEWSRLDVLGLRVADAVIALRFRRDGNRCIFRIEQESGGVPVRLIFEPAIRGRAVVALIDGQPALLEPRQFGERWIAPVQLMLDHERTVELEIEP